MVHHGFARRAGNSFGNRPTASIWLGGMRVRSPSITQCYQSRSNNLGVTGIDGRKAGEQGHGATLGRSPPRLERRDRRLWTTGSLWTTRDEERPTPPLLSERHAILDGYRGGPAPHVEVSRRHRRLFQMAQHRRADNGERGADMAEKAAAHFE
jgi:hypothetical protein